MSKRLEETNQNLVTGLKNAAKVYKEGEKQAKGIVTKDKTTIGGKIVSKIGDKTPDLPRHKSIKEVDIKSEEDAKEYVTELEQKAKDIEMYIAMLNNYRASGQGEPEWLIKKLEELGVTYGIIKNTDESLVNKKESESLYGYDDIVEVTDLGSFILVKYTNGLIQLFNKNDIPRGCLKGFEDRSLWSAGGVPLKTITGFVDRSIEENKDEVIKNLGKATKNNYRTLYLEKYPNLPGDYQVHHTLPQKYESIFKEQGINIHDIVYLKGVDSKIHSKITTEWMRWEKSLEKNPTVQDVIEFAKKIDDKYNKFWFNK